MLRHLLLYDSLAYLWSVECQVYELVADEGGRQRVRGSLEYVLLQLVEVRSALLLGLVLAAEIDVYVRLLEELRQVLSPSDYALHLQPLADAAKHREYVVDLHDGLLPSLANARFHDPFVDRLLLSAGLCCRFCFLGHRLLHRLVLRHLGVLLHLELRVQLAPEVRY